MSELSCRLLARLAHTLPQLEQLMIPLASCAIPASIVSILARLRQVPIVLLVIIARQAHKTSSKTDAQQVTIALKCLPLRQSAQLEPTSRMRCRHPANPVLLATTAQSLA